jgi:hypothetical protein
MSEASQAIPSQPITPAAVSVPTAKPGETLEQKYMRETRNAVTFIAVIIGVLVVLGLIGTIIMGVQLAKLNNNLNGGGGGGISNCLSQGGSDPSC